MNERKGCAAPSGRGKKQLMEKLMAWGKTACREVHQKREQKTEKKVQLAKTLTKKKRKEKGKKEKKKGSGEEARTRASEALTAPRMTINPAGIECYYAHSAVSDWLGLFTTWWVAQWPYIHGSPYVLVSCSLYHIPPVYTRAWDRLL